MTKSIKTQKSDFKFTPAGRGQYQVTYTSPVTLKSWKAVLPTSVTDDVMYEDYPSQQALRDLKRAVKRG